MSASDWHLRPAARADLTGLWQRGAADWGADRADRYLDGLFAVFDLLAEFPELARERPEFSPPLRLHPSGAHLILYRAEAGGVDILRILPARSDWLGFLEGDPPG